MRNQRIAILYEEEFNYLFKNHDILKDIIAWNLQIGKDRFWTI